MNTNDIHACNIIVLGPSGSGKTVFLASMYEKLAKQSTEIPFFIQTSPEQHNKLRKKYLEVSNAGSWPGGTAYDEISEWNFTCLVRPPLGSNQEVLRFSYLDYAGGRITD